MWNYLVPLPVPPDSALASGVYALTLVSSAFWQQVLAGSAQGVVVTLKQYLLPRSVGTGGSRASSVKGVAARRRR